MSINDIETFVLLFPNDEWSDTGYDDSLVAQLRPNVSFTQFADDNLQTLSTRNANQDGTISGFLYVPDLNTDDACYNLTKQYAPANVTRTANLPQTDFTLVALAPWINVDCTFEYMAAARMAPVRALIFYQPGDDTTTPDSNSAAWDLQDGGAWRTHHPFPVYAIPGALGSSLMHQLSLYSGNMTEVPYGHEIAELPDVDVRDYVRLYTEIGLSTKTVLPTLWVYFLIVLAVLVICLGTISGLMHFVQRSRRKSLRRRVANGEVDLEALGIKRLRVPQKAIDRLPLFIYVSEDEKSFPASPQKEEHFVSMTHEDDFSGASTVVGSDPRIYDMMSAKELATAELIPIDEKTPIPDSTLVHRFLPYVQPTCAICLEDFESGISEIRELPCGHIFHPECIDTFLANNSSLCPMCKKSALPIGFCPTIITNAMVRRERNLRRIRSRVSVQNEPRDVEAYGARRRVQDLRANIRKHFLSPRQAVQPLPRQPQPVFVAHPGAGRDQGALSLELSGQDFVERRIRELQAGQIPIRDPDLVSERHKSKWRKNLSKAFPGF
ncbi:hypothetical protein ONS95_009026 [Cadophora gregata]|uniref:uncharacterized protein n=2 Tax=Cadophora gregata TaxID=51156 RepID=UPI0026DC1587|nr:uncharacterized protein ONS95_009026 [Cadophora gregata]KAK0124041.1 hypothetical protein ONS95_009026 [Cadophora gregata]